MILKYFSQLNSASKTLKDFCASSKQSLNIFLKSSQNSIEHLFNERDDSGEIIQQSPIWIRATVFGLISSAVFSLGWLATAKTDEVVTVSGRLEPESSVKNIQMPIGGIADQILVKDGDTVKKDQIVMQLDAETTQKRLKSLIENETLKQLQLKFKQTELQQYLILNKEKESMLQDRLLLEEKILEKFQVLTEVGAAAELQYLQQINRVSEIRSQLNQTLVDRLREEAAQEQQIQILKSDLEEISSKITEAKVNLRYQVLRSPVDGVVFDLQPQGKGYVAQGTETVMKIVPYDTLKAKVEIPSNQIGFVKVGMPVDISIDSFPATDFGVLKGQIISIGSDALAPDRMENRVEYSYPAMIKLEDQIFKVKNDRELPLQVGMSLTSNIKLRKVSYLRLLLGTFQDKIDSLREI